METRDTPTFQKVLIPLDGSTLAEAILPYVLSLAKDLHFSLTLLHVVSRDTPGQREEDVIFSDGFRTVLKTMAGGYLEGIAGRLRGEGLRADTVVTFGSVARRIVGFAERNRFDLIAMSTRGHSGVKRWVYGSVASKVLQTTSLPLLLVKPDKEKVSAKAHSSLPRLLVPLDGSRLAEKVLPYVKVLGFKGRYPISLIRVVAPVSLPAVVGSAGVFLPDRYVNSISEIRKHREEMAWDYVQGVKWELVAASSEVEGKVSVGDPSEEIISVSQQLENPLIVMATHGRSGLGRWVIGSVANRVLEGYGGPMLLVRPGHRRAQQ